MEEAECNRGGESKILTVLGYSLLVGQICEKIVHFMIKA